MCDHRLWNAPDGLQCVRSDPHETGHQYRSSNGSENGEGGHRRPEGEEG